jgi:hypothetical protein
MQTHFLYYIRHYIFIIKLKITNILSKNKKSLSVYVQWGKKTDVKFSNKKYRDFLNFLEKRAFVIFRLAIRITCCDIRPFYFTLTAHTSHSLCTSYHNITPHTPLTHTPHPFDTHQNPSKHTPCPPPHTHHNSYKHTTNSASSPLTHFHRPVSGV